MNGNNEKERKFNHTLSKVMIDRLNDKSIQKLFLSFEKILDHNDKILNNVKPQFLNLSKRQEIIQQSLLANVDVMIDDDDSANVDDDDIEHEINENETDEQPDEDEWAHHPSHLNDDDVDENGRNLVLSSAFDVYINGGTIRDVGVTTGDVDYNGKTMVFEGVFNIMEQIKLNLLDHVKEITQTDHILLSNSCQTTKQEFAVSLKNLSVQLRIKQEGLNLLLSFLKKSLPDINWPTNYSKIGEVKSAIDSYCGDDERIMEFHICPDQGCTAFVGDYSKLICCKECGAHRFRKCAHKDCKNTKYEDCTHTLKNKISHKSIFYRPITTLLTSLFQTEGFIHAIQYSFRNKTKNYKYTDSSNGSTYQRNLREMIVTYNSKFQKSAEMADGTKEYPIMINILLGQFYDGCAVFKNRCSVFWPLNIIIFNLPPTYRVKLGIGMFLISIFTGKLGSNGEDFFLRHLLVSELKTLCDGIRISMKGKHYFLQVRMILSILDTIAVQDFLKVQTVQAKSGCFICKHGKGYNNKIPMCHIGHRNLLPLDHYCRNFGQSKHCCPKGYYDSRKNKKLEDLYVKDQYNEVQDAVLLPTKLKLCDDANTKHIRQFLLNEQKRWKWEFPEVDPTIFQKHLYYHHADYRPYVEYERKTNKSYLENGSAARKFKQNNPEIKKRAELCVNGVLDNWSMSELEYCDVETDLCWGPMHVLMNVAMNIIANWKNERAKSDKTISYCKTTGTHPDIYTLKADGKIDKNKKKKWNINKSMQDKIEAFVLALKVPQGFSSDFQAHFIFQQTGNLYAIGKIQTITVLMPLICTLLEMEEGDTDYWVDEEKVDNMAYRQFYMMLSRFYCKIMSPKFRNDEEIDDLCEKVKTIICLHEGLYPVSESLLVWHQLLDITFHIKKFGPLKCWWEFSGERSLSTLKDYLPRGGISYDKCVMRSYSEYENLKLNDSYNFSIDDIYNLKNRHLKTQQQLNINDEINSFESISVINKKMYYSDEAFYFDKLINPTRKDSTKLSFNPLEINCLLYELVFEVKKRCRDEAEATKKSGLFRLFLMFLERNAKIRKEKERVKKNEKSRKEKEDLKKLSDREISNLERTRNNELEKNTKFAEALFAGKLDDRIKSGLTSYEAYDAFMKEEEELIKNVEDVLTIAKLNYIQENLEIDLVKQKEIETFYDFLKFVTQQEDLELDRIICNEEDVKTAKHILINFLPYKFKNAWVFGIKMESRGMECSERDFNFSGIDEVTTNNELNNLQTKWSDSKSVSCWFKYRYNSQSFDDTKFGCIDNIIEKERFQKETNFVTKYEEEQFCYGQFNYFFRINLPLEPLLNGLPMASAVCRLPTQQNYLQIIGMNSLFLPKKVFVTLTNVCSTKLLIGAVDQIFMPISLKAHYSQVNNQSCRRTFSEFKQDDIAYLYFLDLHPERQSVQYDNLNNSYYRFEYKIQYYSK